jgi:hypothetical protein
MSGPALGHRPKFAQPYRDALYRLYVPPISNHQPLVAQPEYFVVHQCLSWQNQLVVFSSLHSLVISPLIFLLSFKSAWNEKRAIGTVDDCLIGRNPIIPPTIFRGREDATAFRMIFTRAREAARRFWLKDCVKKKDCFSGLRIRRHTYPAGGVHTMRSGLTSQNCDFPTRLGSKSHVGQNRTVEVRLCARIVQGAYPLKLHLTR